MAWTSLCATDELIQGYGKYVEIGGFHLAVFLDGEHIYAIDDLCPHAGGSLSAGHIEAGCAVCPRHAWSFNLADGCLRDMPGVKIHTYPMRRLPREGMPDLVQADLPIY